MYKVNNIIDEVKFPFHRKKKNIEKKKKFLAYNESLK